MARPRFYFGRIDTLRLRKARKLGIMSLIFIVAVLFIFKPTRLALGYLIPSTVRVTLADWYIGIWEDKNWGKTIVLPLENNPLADTVCFLYDQDSFIVMKVYQNSSSERRVLQYIRPTDLPIVVVEKKFYADSSVETLNYFHRSRLHHKSQPGVPKRAFSKEQLEMDAKELFSLYHKLCPLYVKPK